jgi:hypothetical protein
MDRARRLRLIGVLVMACGVLTAAILYWTQTRSAVIDDAAAGFTRAQEHQMKVLMAAMIDAFAGFVAYMCFRHARFE